MSIDVTAWQEGEIHGGDGQERPVLDEQITISWPGRDEDIKVVELYDANGVLYTSPVENKKTVGLYEFPAEIYKMNIILDNHLEEVTLNIFSYDNTTGQLVMSDDYNLSAPHHFEQIKDMAGTYIVRRDIDFAEVAPKQIGSYTSDTDNEPFTGILDGGGFSLNNLAFTTGNFKGLVAFNKGTIKNVVVGALAAPNKLLGNQSSVSTIGAICAINAAEGTIENCTNGARVDGQSNAGGIAGQNRGKIKDCVNTGQIMGVTVGGGIVGLNTAGATVTGCENRGGAMGMTNTGGIAGENAGLVKTVTSSGTILSNSGSGGGIVGHNNAGQIESATNSGAVTVNGTPQYIGGIAGQTSGAGNSILKCRNTGNVSGAQRAGGIAGSVSMGSVTACENTGVIKGGGELGGITGNLGGIGSAVMYCENKGTVTGTATRVGGIVGYSTMCTVGYCINHPAATVKGTLTTGGIVGEGATNNTLQNCYNQAEVISDGDRVGGIAGKHQGAITACKNSGYIHQTANKIYTGGIVAETATNHSITACYNTGQVGGYSNAGGIAGYHNTGCTSTAVYSTGAVTGENTARTAAIMGYNLATGKIYAAWWTGADRGMADNTNTNTDQVVVSQFATPDNTAWPKESDNDAWRVASGSNGFAQGYYWASLGSAPSTYPTLWWEKNPSSLLIGVSAMPTE
jgi:hypothetical protein